MEEANPGRNAGAAVVGGGLGSPELDAGVLAAPKESIPVGGGALVDAPETDAEEVVKLDGEVPRPESLLRFSLPRMDEAEVPKPESLGAAEVVEGRVALAAVDAALDAVPYGGTEAGGAVFAGVL